MIKLFLIDCDGTLTDGIYHTTEKGEISKNFFTRDFHGMKMLSDVGVKISIITAASDYVIAHQCRRAAKYASVNRGIKSKVGFVAATYVDISDANRIDGLKFAWDEIAFIGDDVFDIELMKSVGLCACPLDADLEVLSLIENQDDGFRSSFPGGKGCVREFAEYVFNMNGETGGSND